MSHKSKLNLGKLIQSIENYIYETTHEHSDSYQSKINPMHYQQQLHLGCIAQFDAELAEATLASADQIMPCWKDNLEAMRQDESGMLTPVGIKVMFSSLIPHIKIGAITHENIGQIVKLKGAISSFPEARVEIVFTTVCPSCKNHLKSPKRLRSCFCCNAKIISDEWQKAFKTFQDLQFVEHIDDSAVNRGITIFFQKNKNEELNIVDAYELLFNTIEILGIVTYNEQVKQFEIEILNARTVDDMALSPEQIETTQKFIAEHQHDLHIVLRNHICPHIFGYDNFIFITTTTIIGCSGDPDPQLQNRNPQMLQLNVGKFGRGKSDITKSFIPFLPNSAIINTLSSSKAGMQSGIQRDEKGQFTLVLGTLPRCHNSFAGLEEIDKTEDKGNSYLQVISDGTIRLDKIIQFTKKIHVNFIVNANPIHGDFDTNSTYFSQIDLPSPFIDRADVIIVPPAPYNESNVDSFVKRIFGQDIVPSQYSDTLIRTVMIYLKRHTQNPIILDDGIEEIRKLWYHLQNRKSRQGDDEKRDDFNFEIRALISIIKFVKGWGRLHAYSTMDAQRTVQALLILKEGAYDTFLPHSGGLTDFTLNLQNKQQVKIPESKEQKKHFIIATIHKYKQIEEAVLIKASSDVGIPTATTNQVISALKKDGEILETVIGGKSYYRLGVVDGGVATEYIEKQSCAEWILEQLGKSELTDLQLCDLNEYPTDEVLQTLDILKKNGDIFETNGGKFKRT